MNRRTPTALHAIVASLAIPAAASAQSVTGNAFVTARCSPDGSLTRPLTPNDDFVITRHGECAAPRFGGVASINDASCAVRLGGGVLLGDAAVQSDFRGTQDGAGSASSATNPTFSVNDLVFSDTTSPGRPGNVQVAMHLVLRARWETVGTSNCDPFSPQASGSFNVSAPGGNASGSFALSGGAALSIGGVLTGYPNDGSELAFTGQPASAPLETPQAVSVILSCSAGVSYCDFPPADLGSARAMLQLSLPLHGPVFDLPAGITANSPLLHIVNNRFVPPCGPADTNHDGQITPADVAVFVSTWFTSLQNGTLEGDFDGDGAVQPADIAAFVVSWFAALGQGC